jgi:hypothetical protein
MSCFSGLTSTIITRQYVKETSSSDSELIKKGDDNANDFEEFLPEAKLNLDAPISIQ